MFTGIIEEVGAVVRRGGAELVIMAEKVVQDMQHGESIAIDGACMTVTDFSDSQFVVQVSPESFKKTTLGSLKAGDAVNLERAMVAGGRFGGHIVQGHVDAVGRIERVEPQGEFSLWTFWAPDEVAQYLVPKGSVTVDGISLTVVDPANNQFSVAVIPTTLQETKLSAKRPGDAVNLEADVFAKHVFHYMQQAGSSGLTKEMMSRYGFA